MLNNRLLIIHLTKKRGHQIFQALRISNTHLLENYHIRLVTHDHNDPFVTHTEIHVTEAKFAPKLH